MKFETKDTRESSIRLHKLSKMDEKYIFYYDESNNFRKIRIEDGKLNIPINSNFVLGGVVHEENAIDYDVIQLLDELRLQKSSKEIKLKHIAKGSFIECLKSDKLTTFLKWLFYSDLYVHIFTLNFFYFSIVDIIDSAIVNSEIGRKIDMFFINEMKSNLYTIAKWNEEEFVNILERYQYPNLDKGDIKSFIDEIINFIRVYEDIQELHIGLVSLRQILKDSISKNELPFLEGNTTNILIENFMFFYMNPIYMFKNAMHEFDEEKSIFALIDKYEITYNGIKISNYKEKKSHESRLIQISDVVVGIFAKFFDYVIESEMITIINDLKKIDHVQKENLDLIVALINQSNDYNRAFLHYSISNEDRRKLAYLNC